MAEDKTNNIEIDAKDKNVKSSLMKRGRKTIQVLQKMKDEGKLIVQVCPADRDKYFAMAADMAGCDVLRLTVPGENAEMRAANAPWWIRTIRSAAQYIHINFVPQTCAVASKDDALRNCSIYMTEGADSINYMGITNEMVKYLSDNWVVLFGHVGALSGWQTSGFGGYRKLGKTCEDAMKIFRQAYEYQENGMKAMTVELTPGEVSAAIAKKLRIPVIGVASGCTGGDITVDGYELVDFDTFNMMPSLASHAKVYGDFFKFAVGGYKAFADDVRSGGYPEEKHGWHMDPVELEKFMKEIEKI